MEYAEYMYSYSPSTGTYGVRTIIIPILHMKKLRHRELENLLT